MPDQPSTSRPAGKTCTHEERKEKVRAGRQLHPTPALREAAREVIRPLIEDIHGRNIIYHCRVSFLLRIDQLKVDDQGFEATATVLRQFNDPDSGRYIPDIPSPFTFSSGWATLRLAGTAICMAMLTDHFFTDRAVVAAVEAADAPWKRSAPSSRKRAVSNAHPIAPTSSSERNDPPAQISGCRQSPFPFR